MNKPTVVQAPAPLLAYLFTAWPEVKKKQIRTWLKYRAITINGRPCGQFDHPLKVGDTVAVRSDRHALPGTKVSGVRIVHEDAALIVIDKPDGLLSIASDKETERTVYSYLMDHVRQQNGSGARVWIVHRLDQETSGLMMLAKSELVKRQLQSGWDEVEKKYNAIVEGIPPQETGVIENELDESDPYRVRSAPYMEEVTRHAITQYRVEKKGERNAWVEINLITGRRHQIRVHFSELGFPIVGDKRYGANSNPIKRMALQAKSIKFKHPTTGEPMDFQLNLPGDFANALAHKPGASAAPAAP